MTDIKGVPSTPIQPNATTDQPVAAQQAGLVRPTADTGVVRDVAERTPVGSGTEVASSLPPPSVGPTALESTQTGGAEAFANQLTAIGPSSLSTDGLLLAFLKLQMLEDGDENRSRDLVSRGKLTLRAVAHGTDTRSAIIATNQVRAGTEGLNAALEMAAETQQQRNALVELLGGFRADQELRAESLPEVDKVRNEVAQLVLDLIDQHQAVRASQVQHSS